ncbi:MAG: substrate-binding periplasmic protein [Aeromonadaceae bacterium]
MLTRALLLLLLTWAQLSDAKAVTLIGAEVPPFVMHEAQPLGPGLTAEILLVAAQRLGEPAQLDVKPFVRALMVTANGHDRLLVPPGRIPEREALLRWVSPLVDEAFVLFTDRQHHPKPIRQEELAGLTVGVMRDSVGEQLMKKIPGGHIENAASEIINAKKLARGRIHAWAVSLNTGFYAQRAAGLDERQLVRGATLSRVTLYLAASPDFPDAEMIRWQQVIEAMRLDGTLQRLKQRYHYVEP